jgi:hypothetical protein
MEQNARNIKGGKQPLFTESDILPETLNWITSNGLITVDEYVKWKNKILAILKKKKRT